MKENAETSLRMEAGMEVYKAIEIYRDGAGIASRKMRDELRKRVKPDQAILNCHYTDYGGSFLDKVYIEYYRESDRALIEKTQWNGENAFIILRPKGVSRLEKNRHTDDGIEKLYKEMYEKQVRGSFEYFLEDLRYNGYEYDHDTLMNWLMENKSDSYTIYPGMYDVRDEILIPELEEIGLIRMRGGEDEEIL